MNDTLNIIMVGLMPQCLIYDPLYAKNDRPITGVLYGIAGQGGADGVPYDQIQQAADYIEFLEHEVQKLNQTIAKFIYDESHGEPSGA